MNNFISGVKEKYDERLLENRLTTEGNVIASIFSDPLLLHDYNLKSSDFITKDGAFYFALAMQLDKKGFSVFDEVTILSNMSENVLSVFEEKGGYETIKNLTDIVNVKNSDTYIDNLMRDNILLNLYVNGFNLFSPVEYKNKSVVPFELFKRMDSENVIDWYNAKLLDFDTGNSSSILEEETINFDDKFIDSLLDGEDSGTPFETAGQDINDEDINVYPFLSKQISGLQKGTMSMLGGFSSAGKSTWLIGLIFALINSGEKVILVSNEEKIKKYKVKFIVWLLAKNFRYYSLSKKKLMAGNISVEDKKMIDSAVKFWNEKCKGKVKIVSTNDSNIKVAVKKIRESALKEGFTTFIVDTFKIDEADMSASRTDLCLVKDSRELQKLAAKLDMIGFASVQLAEREKGKLFLDSSVLSNSKQIKEVLENLFLMRTVYGEELDPKNKYFCKPFRYKKINGKWVEEEFETDRTAVWRMLFVEKNRNGDNSSDTGRAYLLRFAGDHAIFRETCQCRPKHGRIE